MLAEELPKGRMSQLHPPRSMRTETVLLFDGFAYDGEPQTAEADALDLRGSRQWREFLQGLAATVCASVFWDWKRVPWQKALLLSDRHAETVRRTLAGGGDGGPGEEDVPAEEPEDFDAGPWEDEGFPLNPAVLEDPEASRTVPRRDSLLAGIRRNAGRAGRRDAPFVPSGCRCASYDAMGPEQTAFYLSWRTQVLRGAYRDTDRGYLWLLLCETVDGDRDAEARLEVLKGLYRAYSPSSEAARRLIGRTCADYAFMTDQDPLWYGAPGDREVVLWMKLRLEPVGRLSMDLLDGLAGLDLGRYLGDGDYDGALNAAVAGLDAHLRATGGKGLAEACGSRTVGRPRELFPDLVHDWDRYVSLRIYSFDRNAPAGRLMAAAAKVAVRAVNVPLGLRRPNRPSKIDAGALEAMEAAAEDWVSGRDRAARAERNRRDAMSIVLDRDAVLEAESDLHAVTELVATDDGEPLPEETPVLSGPEPEPPSETAPPETGFAGLAHSLDDVQKGYLLACLEGSGDAFLRAAGKSRVSVEDSINEAAMDAVGDQVVQDGEVFPEYGDDLRAVL